MGDYIRWQDLVDEEDGASAAPASDRAGVEARPQAAPSALQPDAPPIQLEDLPIPEELRALWQERLRLEKRMQELTGGAPKSEDDERTRQCYPVFVHTVATRIEARRFARRDEEERVLRARALERRAAQAREQQAALLANELARRQRIVERRVEAAIEARHGERLEERAQMEAEEEAQRERWAAQHREAMAARAAAVQREQAWHDERNEVLRLRAAKAVAERLASRAREEAARHQRMDELRRQAMKHTRERQAADDANTARRDRARQTLAERERTDGDRFARGSRRQES
jgi:hypothetical protein